MGLDHLVKMVEDGGLDDLDDAGLVGFLHGFEQLRNRLPLVDHAVIGDGGTAEPGRDVCQATLTRMLTVALRLSPGEAARRVRAAEAVGARTSMLGQPLEPVRPQLAAAQRTGESAPSRWRSSNGRWPGWTGPGSTRPPSRPGNSCSPGSRTSSDRKTCRRLAEQVVDAIDPDGTLPNEQLQPRPAVLPSPPHRDGA